MQVLEQTEKLKRQLNWADVLITGKLLGIYPIKANAKKLLIIDNDKKYYVQAWDYAYNQILKSDFVIGEDVSCFAWPSYFNEGKDMRLKTNCLFTPGTVWKMCGTVNSEWLKTTSKGKDTWQFTIKDGNKNGRIIHCTVPRDSLLMREIEKGREVQVIGYPNFEYEQDIMRINLDVVYIGENRHAFD